MSEPEALCACGCGRPAPLATKTNRARGNVKGQPQRFLKGHHRPGLRHGHARGFTTGGSSAEYQIWASMIRRCHRESAANYYLYGGRGISVCERWREDFAAFLEDVGLRPGPDFSLDRIDPDGHYEPSNVRWATAREQARNKRNNRRITINGITHALIEWAELAGIHVEALASRLNRGMDPYQAVWTPSRRRRDPDRHHENALLDSLEPGDLQLGLEPELEFDVQRDANGDVVTYPRWPAIEESELWARGGRPVEVVAHL